MIGVLAALALAATPQPVAEPAAAGERSAFSREENARLYAVRTAATEDARADARRALARLYARENLHVEAIAALGDLQDDEARLMRARASLALLRNEAALEALGDERLAEDPAAAALRAVALARLGAYRSARAEFARAALAADAAPAFVVEFYLLNGESALATDDLVGARAALAQAQEAGADPGETEFLAASIAAAAHEPVRESWRRLAKSTSPAIAARTGLRLLAMDLQSGALSPARARADLSALRLKWRGGAFDRERLEVEAAVQKDLIGRIAALRSLALGHPRSDAAADAKSALHAALRALLDDRKLDPREVARAFYATVDFAPRGAEGDAMVRAHAERLVRLDLLKEAAELLDHQVDRRLRGVERSAVAADLAQIYLDDRRPGEALRVLRATRIAGLDAETLDRRKRLEATALERTGAADAALELLSASGAADLRAAIAWRAENWAVAAESYRALLEGAAAPLSGPQREALLRAGAAYILANDAAAFAAFRAEASERFGEIPEQELLGVMSLDGGAAAKFLDAYRRLYTVQG